MSSESAELRAEICSHDFRVLFPRHVVGLQRTGVELPLGYVCCKCGLGPRFVMPSIAGWRTYFRGKAGAFEVWPDDLKITDYEQGHQYEIVVSFERIKE